MPLEPKHLKSDFPSSYTLKSGPNFPGFLLPPRLLPFLDLNPSAKETLATAFLTKVIHNPPHLAAPEIRSSPISPRNLKSSSILPLGFELRIAFLKLCS
ncbi:Protoporphyrinogen IX oxidase, aerobic [Corchorus olitorius]|uniref:Protoporphyrinogen IX oxidase, aerobic n=1 Tax=Corchorus olitorius TaxID=93759 RepID=A0A1R3KNW2_9ROSI|nr:Protoporphyrinogen IX oxidase, aerobic [Corchorus olitorius]